jgi:hypothetical protein
MNDGWRGWNFESQCHTEIGLLYEEEDVGEIWWCGVKGLKGIMVYGRFVCEGRRTLTGGSSH